MTPETNLDRRGDVKLRLTIKELMVDERTGAAARAIARSELITPGTADGRYRLRFLFDRNREEHQVRIEGGVMLAG
jgi:hypothetical protein